MTGRCACSAPAVPRAPSSTGSSRRAVDEVRVFNRTRARAEAGRRGSSVRASRPSTGPNRSDGARDAGVLVNTTGAGIEGRRLARHGLRRLQRGLRRRRHRLRAARDAAAGAGARARTAHCGWPGHAAASGCARLREMVRRASTRSPTELRDIVVADIEGRNDADRRPHRLDRHGQVHSRGAFAGARHCRCSTPTRRCIASMPVEKLWRRSRRAFPGTTANGGVDRAKLSAALLADAGALPRARGDRASAGARRRARVPRGEQPSAAPRSPCWRSRCCSRPARDALVDATIVVSAPPERAARAAAGAAGHDGGEARPAPGAPDARCREARAAPISLWTRAATSPRREAAARRQSSPSCGGARGDGVCAATGRRPARALES